jgi:hypothetical protein
MGEGGCGGCAVAIEQRCDDAAIDMAGKAACIIGRRYEARDGFVALDMAFQAQS